VKPFTRHALPGTVVFGHGALAQLPEHVALLGAARPLLLAGATPALTAQVEALLPDRAGTWTDIRQHVPAELADQCHQYAADLGADLLVCVGGGSTTKVGSSAPAATFVSCLPPCCTTPSCSPACLPASSAPAA